MKKTLTMMAISSAALLSGCADMMYGSGSAPVTNQNTYYGAPVDLRNGSATGQTTTTQTSQVAATQSGQKITFGNPTAANTSIPSANTPATSVNTIQTIPPSVQQNASNTMQSMGTSVQSQVNQSSPYGTTAPATQTTSTDDGWSIRGSDSNTPPTATDIPKVEGQTGVTGNTQPEESQGPTPIRPSTSSTAGQTSAVTTATENTNGSSESTQVASATPPSGSTSTGQTAVSVLLQKASSELGKGNLDGAAAYLEDAQRIDSKNPKIAYDIANIRYHQGNYSAAESSAAKAVRIGGSNSMMKKSWSLIANARKAQGDNQGAIAAAEKVDAYQ